MRRTGGLYVIAVGLILIAPEVAFVWWSRANYIIGVRPAWIVDALVAAAIFGLALIGVGALLISKIER
jgi:hypothetical protein